MADKEKLMADYHRMIHEIAVARNPIEAETARNIAENVITMLSVKLPEREINDMKQTVSCFYWKAERRLSEGL
ncbi:MAG: hypothetical protein J5864_03025 [Oscillospiraceae bacterium]|nr:hypothetical protein [Oscillospiraceae bacterium]